MIVDSYVVDKNCNDALDHLNNACDIETPFTFISDISTINSYRCVRHTLEEAISVVIERWGGHLIRDNYNVEIRENIGEDRGVVLSYAKNIKSIKATENWDNVVTKLSGVLYVLDEPSIGLHQRDSEKLINSLKEMRDLGKVVKGTLAKVQGM